MATGLGTRRGTQYGVNQGGEGNPGGGNGGDEPPPPPPPEGGGGDPEAGDGEPEGGGGDPPPPPPPGGAGGQPPVVFSLTPGLARQGEILDYSTKAGGYHYAKATARLSEEDLYDCDPEGFHQFLKSLNNRARSFGWTDPGGIFWVPQTNQPGAEVINVLTDYGRIDLERITEHENTYVATQTRAAQNDRQLYECLVNSLSKTGIAKLNVHEKQYTLGAQKLPSGLCFFKVLIRESHLDSNATTSTIRTDLSNLDEYIQKCGNDITKFNSYVTVMLESLAARGETTNDLLTNLFKGYAASSDNKFVEYIAKKQSDWEEGQDLDATLLMELAANKYKILVTKGIWEAPSPEEEKLIALEARFAELKKRMADKRKRGPKFEDYEGLLDRPPTKKAKFHDGGKKKPKKPSSTEKPAWMFIEPDEKDLHKPHMWNGKPWYWCSKKTGGKCEPAQYRVHKPAACRGTAFKKKKNADGDQKAKKDGKKKVVIQEAVKEIEGGYETDE